MWRLSTTKECAMFAEEFADDLCNRHPCNTTGSVTRSGMPTWPSTAALTCYAMIMRYAYNER